MLRERDIEVLCRFIMYVLAPSLPCFLEKESCSMYTCPNGLQKDTWIVSQSLWERLMANGDIYPILQQLAEDAVLSPDNNKFEADFLSILEPTLKEKSIFAQEIFDMLGGDHGLKNLAEGRIYLEALNRWLNDLSKGLSPPSRVLFQFLCAIDEDDRGSGLIIHEWDSILRSFGLELIAFDDALAPLLDLDLIEKKPEESNQFRYVIDPMIAAAVLAKIEKQHLVHIYAHMVTIWIFRCMYVFDLDPDQIGEKDLLLHVAMKAIGYQLKLGDWKMISVTLRDLINHDTSSKTIMETLPLIRQAVTHTFGTEDELPSLALLANALREIEEYDEAEKVGQSLICTYMENEEYGSAFHEMRSLSYILLKRERYKEALDACSRALQYGYLAERTGRWPEARIIVEDERYLAIAQSHYFMAICLENLGIESMPHLLAAGIIYLQVKSEHIDSVIETGAKIILRSKSALAFFEGRGPVNLPESFDEICEAVNEVENVDFKALSEKLTKYGENGNNALKIVLNEIYDRGKV